MLISVDFDENKVDIISIPRDSYVKIPGREKREKINAAFARGGGFKGKGFEKTIETVSHFLGGIPIQYYIGIDMNVVKDVVDIMGGVDYDVDLRVRIGDRVLEKGFQHLSGQQVLDYARTRNTAKGDIDRIDRQQKIVLAIFKELKSTKQILKLPQYYTTVMERVHTNMDIKQIAGLALFAVNLELEDINRHTIPGGFLNMDKISYWGIHEWKKKELIKDIFGVDIEIDPKNDIQYIKKELAEKEKAFMEVAAQGKEIVGKANRFIEDYERLIREDEINRIKIYISQVDHEVESGDIDTLKKWFLNLKSILQKLQSILGQLDDAVKKAETLLAETAVKIKDYREFITKEEKDTLDKRMNDLRKALNSRETKSINELTNQLKEYSVGVFKECQNRKEAKEKKDRKTRKRSDREEKAIKNAKSILENTENKMIEYEDYLEDTEKDGLNKKLANLRKILDSKDSDAKTINSAAQDLKEYGDKVFSECQQRKEGAEEDDTEKEDEGE